MLSPVYTPAPFPGSPHPGAQPGAEGRISPQGGQGRRRDFGIYFSMPLRFCKSLPACTPELPCVFAGQKRERHRGKGHQTCSPASFATFHVNIGDGGRTAGTQPRTQVSQPPTPRSERCSGSAKLQHDHNSNDGTEGDGSHPTERPANPSRLLGKGKRGENGGSAGVGASPAWMPRTAPWRDTKKWGWQRRCGAGSMWGCEEDGGTRRCGDAKKQGWQRGWGAGEMRGCEHRCGAARCGAGSADAGQGGCGDPKRRAPGKAAPGS